MGRAQGKNGPRSRGLLDDIIDTLTGEDEDKSSPGERRQEGIGDQRIIPGGKKHLANPPVEEQAVPVPATEWPYRNAILAHGVEPDGHMHERDPRLTGSDREAHKTKSAPESGFDPIPVPVYIVERVAGRRSKPVVDTRKFTLPAAGSEPVMLAGASPDRALIQLLNEDSSHNARFGDLADLTYDASNGVITGGARLPSGASGYTVIRTQEAVYGISETSNTVAISVILETELRASAS